MRSAFDAGQQGIQNGMQRMSRAAAVLSKDVDPEAIIDLKLAGIEAKAGAKVISSVEKSLGALIDDIG